MAIRADFRSFENFGTHAIFIQLGTNFQKIKVNHMKTQTVQISMYEEQIISIMHRLPHDRILQLVDYAEFLEKKSSEMKTDEEAEQFD